MHFIGFDSFSASECSSTVMRRPSVGSVSIPQVHDLCHTCPVSSGKLVTGGRLPGAKVPEEVPPKVKTLANLIHQHWSIESSLHWVLDVTFPEDKSRIRKQHAPQTSALWRRMAVCILQGDTSLKDSLRGKRYRACLSTNNLERILLSSAQIKMRVPWGHVPLKTLFF